MLTVLITGTVTLPVYSSEWEDGFPLQVTYEELEGNNVDVTLTMVLPTGTPLLAREAAISSFLSALQDIWNIESVHEDVRGFLGPVVPVDVQNVVSHVNGTSFVTAMMDAFEAVSDAGFSRFQEDTEISVTETVVAPVRALSNSYPDAPRFFAWIVGEGWTEAGDHSESWVIASLINYSAAVLSFRSEFGRFPTELTELREMGHLLIEPLNPYTGEPVATVNHMSPGDISYELNDSSNVSLMTYLKTGAQTEIVRRQISVPASGSYDLLYRQLAGLSESDKKVARYTFQLAQILNEYYYQYTDLPYRIPQCEAEGFAYVSFVNPYTGMDAQVANNFSPESGDYYYQRITSDEYFLVGYGANGKDVIMFNKNFLTPQVQMGPMRVQ